MIEINKNLNKIYKLFVISDIINEMPIFCINCHVPALFFVEIQKCHVIYVYKIFSRCDCFKTKARFQRLLCFDSVILPFNLLRLNNLYVLKSTFTFFSLFIIFFIGYCHNNAVFFARSNHITTNFSLITETFFFFLYYFTQRPCVFPYAANTW